MEDTQREPRVTGTSENEQSEETRTEAPAAIVARMLANPRRVRRN
jgi:hypothetical protein